MKPYHHHPPPERRCALRIFRTDVMYISPRFIEKWFLSDILGIQSLTTQPHLFPSKRIYRATISQLYDFCYLTVMIGHVIVYHQKNLQITLKSDYDLDTYTTDTRYSHVLELMGNV